MRTPTVVRRILLLLVIVVSAGCLTGGLPDRGDSADEPPAAFGSEETAINESTLAHEHFDTLRGEGSFALNRSSTTTIDGDTRIAGANPDWHVPPSYSLRQVDLEGERFYQKSVTVGHSRAEKYVSPGETARRRKSCTADECEFEYNHLERSEADDVTREIDRFRNQGVVDITIQMLEDWNFTYTGTVDRNGETVYQYHGEWTGDKPMYPFDAQPNSSGELLVSEEGVIRSWEYQYSGAVTMSIDGEQREVEVIQRSTQTYSAVGETTITRPDWVATAETEDPPPTTESADT